MQELPSFVTHEFAQERLRASREERAKIQANLESCEQDIKFWERAVRSLDNPKDAPEEESL